MPQLRGNGPILGLNKIYLSMYQGTISFFATRRREMNSNNMLWNSGTSSHYAPMCLLCVERTVARSYLEFPFGRDDV
jgi:hypothetical protein